MSIFGNILDKIFHHAGHRAPAAAPSQPAPSRPAAPSQPASPSPAQAAAPDAAAAQPVDVEAVLTQMSIAKGGQSNWRTSIVDLLKLLDLDSGLEARKQLANELQLHVAADGSAAENLALHKAVMQRLAENGGKVPADLRD
ncbi:MAG: DUF3597 domain-containing protein [Sphingomonadales bacterium]|nr:DUF3597 domain-containing protein [Sphingomonadales bacterium]